MCGPVFLSFSRGIEPAAFWSLDNLLCWAPAGRRLGAFSSWRARCFLKELLYVFSASSFISHIPLVFLLFPPGFKAFSFSCLSIDLSLILRYWRCGRTSDPIYKKTNETQKNQLFSQSGALIISNVQNLILNNVFVCFQECSPTWRTRAAIGSAVGSVTTIQSSSWSGLYPLSTSTKPSGVSTAYCL